MSKGQTARRFAPVAYGLCISIAAALPLHAQVICQEATITVDGTDNIYGAGHQPAQPPYGDPPAPGGDHSSPPPYGGTWPQFFGFAAGTGQIVTFEQVLEIERLRCGGGVQGNEPDGGTDATGTTDICSYHGISGIIYEPSEGHLHGKTMFLVGVFLTDAEPSDPPEEPLERLDFSADALTENFDTLAPNIGQVFFIGDGRQYTGYGTYQRFIVPANATRLFLGFADAYDFGMPEKVCSTQPATLGRCPEPLEPTPNSCPGYYSEIPASSR